jgi:hypothetical protein
MRAVSGREPSREPSRDLGAALRSLRELGRFEEAAALVRGADPTTMPAPLQTAAGAALTAVSEYDAAAVHLILAAGDVGQAPRALAGLAELAWLERDYARGQAFAIEGLAIDPSHHECRIQLHRNESGLELGSQRSTGRLSHAAVFADPQGNAGDRVLTEAVRRCFRTDTGPRSWISVPVHQRFDQRRLAEVNAGDALIVGGGGLFTPDLAPNGHSGWQWNVPDDLLGRIDVPLVVFAVGYTMFEGQQFSALGGGRFRESLRTLVEAATFIGLRNHGSVDRVRELLPAALADRVRWQPCPTTLGPPSPAGPVEPDQPTQPTQPAGSAESGAVLLNCAYDRPGQRYGDGYGRFLGQLRDWVLSTGRRAEVKYVAHCVEDEKFVVDLRREHGLTLPVIPLYDRTPEQTHAVYRAARLVVGMHGHAGMIPFGCGTPIISLISHPQLGFFLDDIERPEWGLSIRDPQLSGRLRELTAQLLDSHPEVVADIGRIHVRLREVTEQNLRRLPAVLQHRAA